MTKQTFENIAKTTKYGVRGILATSAITSQPYKKGIFIFSFIAAIALPLITLALEVNIYLFISEIKNVMIAFLPGILGFTIAGYTLVVGFVQSNMLEKISEPNGKNGVSLYQKMSGVFAINVIVQAFALIIAFMFHLFIFIDTKKDVAFNLTTTFVYWFNIICLSFLLFWFFLSLLITIQIIINIFGFSQFHHYFIVKGKIDELKDDKPNCIVNTREGYFLWRKLKKKKLVK